MNAIQQAAALVLSALLACPRAADPPAVDPNCVLVPEGFGPKGTAAVRVETVVSGLEVPWSIGFLPGGDMLVTERPGRVRLVRGGELGPVVATVPTAEAGEGGLLGLALAPDFLQSRLFFLYFTTANPEGRPFNRVERWALSADHASARRDKVIVPRMPAGTFHDGGRLRFGPDGMLYVGTGDARRPELPQRQASLAGKLLRLTPDGDVPTDNPTPASPVFLSGIRNTEGFDWLDPQTLVVADHGPSGELHKKGHDEINIAHAGDDLGWPLIYACESADRLVSPRLTWKDAVPPGGAAIYRGAAIPEWQGSLLVGTLGSKHLHRVVFEPKEPHRVTAHEVYFLGDPPEGLGRLRDVVMGPDGDLYVTTSNCDGRGTCPPEKDSILRITR